MIRIILRLVIVGMLLAHLSRGYAQPSGEEILKKVEANFPGVQDYTVNLDVTADVERMNVPPMNVRMYYKQPDRFHFESDGFALLPRDGLAFSVSKLLSRFSIKDVGEEEQGIEFWLLLRPKDERAKITKLLLSIDAAQWKPSRVVSSFYDGRTMTVMFQYEKQNGYLMPSQLTVDLSAPPADTTDQMPDSDLAQIERSQMPRKGTITIKYSSYKINTGLSDDIFDKK